MTGADDTVRAKDGARTRRQGRLATFGETMGLVSSLDVGRIDNAHRFTFSFGGAESNVAIGLGRLGGEATWIGRLGRD